MLRFDFYIPSYNLLIEYNGMQHFKPIERFGREEAFKSLQIRDEIKKNYAINNEFNFLSISYKIKKRNDIFTTLENEFTKINKLIENNNMLEKIPQKINKSKPVLIIKPIENKPKNITACKQLTK